MKSVPLDQQISFWVKTYFRLSEARRRAIRYIFFLTRRYKEAIFKLDKLCAHIGWHENSGHKFIRMFNGFLFDVIKRFKPSGRQLANEFSLNKYFKQALEWLDLHGYLCSPKTKWVRIIFSIENSEKVYPPPLKRCTPILEILNTKDKEYGKAYVHPKIDQIKIGVELKIQCSKYPEVAIIEGLDDVLWYRDQGNVIKNAGALLLAQIQRRAGVRK